MITIQDVRKSFGPIPVLQGINLTIPDKSIFGIIGLSGAGKTTLLRCLNLLETIDSGNINVNGLEISVLSPAEARTYQRKVGMIFQHFNLLESKTVYDNVALPLKMNKERKLDYDERVRESIDFVGLTEFIDKYPSELSGGQKQRIGIARALVHQPEVLLCDEATSALDPQTSKKILELLKKVNETYGITIVLITHQMEVIREICTEVALIEKGEIVEQGTIFDVFTNPRTPLAKEFVGPIIQQELPEQIRLNLSKRPDVRCYKLTFLNDNADAPLLSTITQKHNIHSNILFGNINEIQGKFFGQLTVELLGDDDNIEQVLIELAAANVLVQGVDLRGGN